MNKEKLLGLKVALDKSLGEDDVVKSIREVKAAVESKPPTEKVKHVVVDNQTPALESVKVSNLKDLKLPTPQVNIPDEVSIRKGWLGESLGKVTDTLQALVGQLQRMVFKIRINDTTADKPVPVRLSDGKRFYTAMTTIAQKAGGVPFRTSAGAVKEALIDDDGHLQVDVLTSSFDNYQYMGKQTIGTLVYFGFKEYGTAYWFIMRKDLTDTSAWQYAYSSGGGNTWTVAWGAPGGESFSDPPDS
jgi:hypothetical protein